MSLRLMYSPILLRSIAQVLLLKLTPSKSGSGIRRYNKKWEETFHLLEFDENLQGDLQIMQKMVEDLFRGWWALDYQTIH